VSEEVAEARATKVSSRRAVSDVAVQLGGQVVNVALGIVTTVVIVRALGATEYGQWATLLAAAELVALVGYLGLEPVAVRFATREPEREGAWVGAATSLQLTLAIPIIAVFVAVLTVLAADREMLITGLIFSVLYLTSALSTLRVIFRLHVRNHVVVAFTIMNSLIWTASVVLIASAGGSLTAYALAFVGTAIVIQGSMALLALRTIKVRWRGSTKMWRRLAGVGISVGIASALTFTYGRIDQILVYELAPASTEVGVYAAVYKLLDNAAFVPVAVMTTLFPIMSGLYPRQLNRLHRIMQRAIDYLSIVAFGGLALTIVAATPIVTLLYGADFAEGAELLPILFAAFIPICIGTVAGNMVIAADLQRRYILYALLGLLLNVPLNILLIPEYGVHAAAWITVLTEFVVVSVTLVTVLRKIEMTLHLRRILLAALAAIAAAAAVWGLRQAGAGAIVLIATMAVLYPPALVGLRALDLGELRSLIRNRMAPETP
jgi:O-antigen/teichoic acid export membrane protein